MARPKAATAMATEKEVRESRRARFDPANLTDERKTILARRLAVYWVAGAKHSAYALFTNEMVGHYEWTPEEVRTFLFTQSQRLHKAWRTLGDWQDGYGEITFND